MKRKILFIITQSEFGGAQRFLSTLAPKLDPQKYEILVATGSAGDEHFTEHLKNLEISNITLLHLVRSPHPWHDIMAVFEIRRLIRKFRPQTLFLLSSKAGFLGSLASKFVIRHSSFVISPKVIYRIGGWAFNDPQSWLRRWLIIAAERMAARWKDIIIVNNRHDLEQADRLRIRPRENLKLIHNGLDVYKMKFLPRDAARQKLQLPSDSLVVGAIANFYPSKGLRYFVEVAKVFQNDPRIIFVIIGSGAEKPPFARNVRLAGRISEASRFLPAFDIFVSSSVKEGFQWSVLEAMAAKLPVVATTVGATPEIIEDGKNGFLVAPRHPERIADRLHQLIANERIRQEFGIQGHQTVLHKFDLEKMIQRVLEILN